MSNPYETVTLVAVAQYRRGYAEALHAAREAVAALCKGHWDGDACTCERVVGALAAIDALRERTP